MSFCDFARGMSARELDYHHKQAELGEIRDAWRRAEQLLAILRSVEFPEASPRARFELWRSGPGLSSGGYRPEDYPSPAAERAFGPIMLPGRVANLELLAGALGAFFRLVYAPSESTWYFEDYAVGAFRPTTDEKVALLASTLATRRALASADPLRTHLIAVRPLVHDIVAVARHLLAADSTFFRGEHGAVRFIDGRLVAPMRAPSYALFAESAVEPRPGAVLTMSHAYHGYFRFCQPRLFEPVRRTEFKERFTNETLSRWGVGMRHDLVIQEEQDGRPRTCQGWQGLALREEAGLN